MGLRVLFENHPVICLVAETRCVEDLVDLAMQHKPDVVLVDLQLNNGNCIEHISKLLNACPQIKVLAFSHSYNEQTCLEIFRSGVVGIISKQHSSELLLKAIHAIYAGQIWFDRHITKLLWQAQFNANLSPEILTDVKALPFPKLSESERQVAYLACKGLSAKEISLQLCIAEKTVRNQLSIIYKKIGVKKQIELCLKAPLFNHFKDSHTCGISFPEDQEK